MDVFAAERDPQHILLFSFQEAEQPDAERGIYALTFEGSRTRAVTTLEGRFGLDIYPSPDGLSIVAARLASGDTPQDSLMQYDFDTGARVDVPLYRPPDWLIPIVPGRRPGEEVEIAEGRPLETALTVLAAVVWAPDSSGYLFTLAGNLSDADRAPNTQTYYVSRGDASAVPIAERAPGNAVGARSAWSPSGRYVSYVGGPWEDDIWVVDMTRPEDATRVIEGYEPRIAWLQDERQLLYGDYNILGLVTYPTGGLAALLDPDYTPGQIHLYELLGYSAPMGMFIAVEQVEVAGVIELEHQRVLAIDLRSHTVQAIVEGEAFSHVVMVRGGGQLWLIYDSLQTGTIVDLGTGDVMAGPSPRLCPPLEDMELQYGPTSYMRAFSPDMHLAALEHNGRLMIWDVLTGEYTEVAPELEGEKTFIGWIPDPDAWEAAIAGGAP